jgi:hypothetical protein
MQISVHLCTVTAQRFAGMTLEFATNFAGLSVFSGLVAFDGTTRDFYVDGFEVRRLPRLADRVVEPSPAIVLVQRDRRVGERRIPPAGPESGLLRGAL